MRAALVLLLFLTAPAFGDSIDDQAARDTGIDMAAGAPLFVRAKRDSYAYGTLEGAVIRCGASAEKPTGWGAMIRSFGRAESDQLVKLSAAAVTQSVLKIRPAALTQQFCVDALHAEKALGLRMLVEFE